LDYTIIDISFTPEGRVGVDKGIIIDMNRLFSEETRMMNSKLLYKFLLFLIITTITLSIIPTPAAPAAEAAG